MAKKCPECKGEGNVDKTIIRFQSHGFEGKEVGYKQTCPRCRGKGMVSKKNYYSPSRNIPGAYDDPEETSRG